MQRLKHLGIPTSRWDFSNKDSTLYIITPRHWALLKLRAPKNKNTPTVKLIYLNKVIFEATL